MARFELSQREAADLDAIVDYTLERWGRRQARTYVTALRERLTMLAERPPLGRPRDELAAHLRSFAFESHVIYYTTSENGIVVVRTLHMRQDAAGEIG